MSRAVYTYTDLTKLNKNKNFIELMKYPQITVSADLRKCLNGSLEYDKVQGLVVNDKSFRVTEFYTFSRAIDEEWTSDQSKFNEMIILSEFIREKIEASKGDEKRRNWLVGCMRNLDSVLSAIILLEQADARPEDLLPSTDRNITLFVEAWENLIKRDSTIMKFRSKMKKLTLKKNWGMVFKSSFNIESLQGIDTIVFHGFYYITPYQELIMRLLEKAGFILIYLIPYDVRYPYVYEIWDKTYSIENGYEPKSQWHIEKSYSEDSYGEIFEGRKAHISNNLEIKEYVSIMEFVDDVKHIREMGFSIYSANDKDINKLLKEYFPEVYGDRKILAYPIGQFVSTLNRMWDEDRQTIAIDEDMLIECFSSGWLAVDGVSGKQYMQDLMYVLPFFRGCHTINEWEKRISYFKEIQENVIAPFEVDLDAEDSVSRWQEAIGSPLKNFSMFSVESEKVDIILKLIKQLLNTARNLFGKNETVYVHDQIHTLNLVLKKNELSQEMYSEEREIVKDIFEKLNTDNSFDALCHPSDIARALDLFICGRYEDGEVQSNSIGMVYPIYFIEAACVKNNSKVHLCMSDVNSLPGGNKNYVWPLTGKVIKKVYEKTKNIPVHNIIQNIESTALCNRYFTYSALKNKEVTISWVSSIGDKMLAPSPYIKLLLKTTGIELIPSARNLITYKRVKSTPIGFGRIKEYDNEKTPANMIKEASMDYALCPMKYVLGYVVEKYPTYQSEFQMNYALNAFISAIYNLMKGQGINVEQAYEAVIELFPNMRKVEKRQVFDYISYDRSEDDMDYGFRSECGGKFYTDERLKIHNPNQDTRAEVLQRYGKLKTSDGRKGLNLYELIEVSNACIFCQHINYCRNALYARDQENYYD